MVWQRLLLITFCTFFASSSLAVTVLTSVKPIEMITHELVKDTGRVDVLLENNASPHDYALRPSDLRKISSADLIIWFGEGLEPFLTKMLAHTDQKKVLTISSLDQVPFRHFGELHHDDEHDDDGHHHGTQDPHFWLGADTVKVVAQHITRRLIAIDKENSRHYQSNLEQFLHKLDETDQQISSRLTPYQAFPYYVFHDAYGYFEEHYQLSNQGFFTVSPERKPGAKTLIKIRKALAKDEQVCVFAEPQFQPAVIESVMRGTHARLGILDPLASDIDVRDGSYFEFLTQLANSFEQCFRSQ